MHPHFNSDYVVVLEDGSQLKLSRSRHEHLELRLKALDSVTVAVIGSWNSEREL
ncbi:MAG TPA: hypothetical protein VF899_18995 [Pyrinomonadaceae bacterium]